MATLRKNQTALTQQEWADFIDAINKLHGVKTSPPAYRAFVKVHVQAMDSTGMSWRVHTMGPGMPGVNFLAWHRRLILRFEQRLQKVNPAVALPYWDAVISRQLPAALSDPVLLKSWSVTRSWNPAELPMASDLKALAGIGTFTPFQSALEASVHNAVHRAVGGDMATAASPTDPLFVLHHAHLDRIWAEWQKAHPGQVPPNKTETLKPKPLFGVKVADLLSIATLGYSYQ